MNVAEHVRDGRDALGANAVGALVGDAPQSRGMRLGGDAYASITFYLGVNLFTHLDADRARTEAMFELAGRVAPRARLLTVRLPRRRS